MFSAKVLLDSQGSTSRLTTLEITYPRCVHAEMLRHRVFSRNTASSRAIPIAKVIEQVETNPFIPIHWGAAQGGMQAYQEVCEEDQDAAEEEWLTARSAAVYYAKMLVERGLHKQVVNRILEPWVWTTEIISGTQWSNFFHLRCHEAAEPHCRKIAEMIRDAIAESTPKILGPLEWHIPMAEDLQDESLPVKLAVATGRLARVSYLTHNGERDIAEDIKLHQRLIDSGHMSPTEHCAQNVGDCLVGSPSNFGLGWYQYRKTFFGECK